MTLSCIHLPFSIGDFYVRCPRSPKQFINRALRACCRTTVGCPNDGAVHVLCRVPVPRRLAPRVRAVSFAFYPYLSPYRIRQGKTAEMIEMYTCLPQRLQIHDLCVGNFNRRRLTDSIWNDKLFYLWQQPLLHHQCNGCDLPPTSNSSSSDQMTKVQMNR